ncbi:MAG: hypothetical protein KDB23_08025 [Planctomycetales bacterium]|nr:hypothetical protein [Planctomycetales bacterium]
MKWSVILGLFLSSIAANAKAKVNGFAESFTGDGGFLSSDGLLVGLDNPGWVIDPGGELSDDGFVYSVDSPLPEAVAYLNLQRVISGQGSYDNEVRLRDLDFGVRGSSVRLEHYFDLDAEFNSLTTAYISLPPEPNGMWRFGLSAHSNGSSDITSVFVPPSKDVILSVEYNAESETVVASYRPANAMRDEATEITLPMDVVLSSESVMRFQIGSQGIGSSTGVVSEWKLQPALAILGDFDVNGIVNALDVDLLSLELQENNPDIRFDINGDMLVDQGDLGKWVHDVKSTYYGDTNLDGEFDSSDLINAFQAGQYEDSVFGNSTWSTGDWNADREFTTSDFVVAFQDGGYEQGPRTAVASVPEPHALIPFVIGAIGLLAKNRVQKKYANG